MSVCIGPLQRVDCGEEDERCIVVRRFTRGGETERIALPFQKPTVEAEGGLTRFPASDSKLLRPNTSIT